MAPKKDKGKKEDEKTGVFNEVEKTFLELQIAECNRKIARLRAAVDEYETRNEELQKSYEKLDEDRADIIAYLKKTLTAKNEENSELKEKVRGLEEIRDIENAQFKETVTQLEKNFTIMKDQLTSENKLLAGKINTLEEFRCIRDDLMKKFEKQEEDFQNQEMKYKRIIYNAEKKFVIGKDKLKKEMEARLLQLAQDFQDATELRIAATTHRVIRENISLSNELDNVLSTQRKVTEQNEQYKEVVRAAAIAKELAEEEKDKAINKSVVQLKVIDQLTAAFENIKKEKSLYEKRSFDFETLQAKIEKLTKENEKLSLQVRILEQHLHVKLAEEHKAVVGASKMSAERDKLMNVLKEAAFAIHAALNLEQWADADVARQAADRKLLLSHLLEIVSQFREIHHSESLSTVASFSKVYEEGDLGFIPKTTIRKKKSTDEFLAQEERTLQEPIKGVDKRSVISTSASTSSASSSIKTIPSIQVIPVSSEDQVPIAAPSVESFATSIHSEISEDVVTVEEDTEGKSDVEKLLLASKLEIQKSIMKDLELSQISFKRSRLSTSSLPSKLSVISALKKKSVTILESVENVERLEEVTELETDQKEKEDKEEVVLMEAQLPPEDSEVSVSMVIEKESDQVISEVEKEEDKSVKEKDDKKGEF